MICSWSSNVKQQFWALASFLFIEYSDQTQTKHEPSPKTLPPRAGDNSKGWESADLHASFQLRNVWLMERWACMMTTKNIKSVLPTSVCLDHLRSVLCGMRMWPINNIPKPLSSYMAVRTEHVTIASGTHLWSIENHRWETQRHLTVQPNLR